MIKLDVKPYCENCPDFEPWVEKEDETITVTDPIGYSRDFGLVPDVRVIHNCNTTVMCKHRHKCNCMMEHLEERKQKEKKDG